MLVVGASVSITPVLATYPTLAGQFWRYGGAALVLWLIVWSRRHRIVSPTPAELTRIVALAAIGLAGFNVLLLAATQVATPTLVATVIGASPLALATTSAIAQRRRPPSSLIVGALMVTAAVAISQQRSSVTPQHPTTQTSLDTTVALGLCLATMACEVAFSLIATPLLPRLGAWNVSAWACSAAVPLLGAAALVAPGPDLVMPNRTEALAIAWLAVVTMAIAFGIWYSAVGRLGAGSAGLLTGVIPLGALGAHSLPTASAPSPVAAAAAILACCGIALGLVGAPSADSRSTAPHPHPEHQEIP